ncbi:MAG: hypothetical protein DRP42_03790 [Tenericutes bacterium]|nr:MAG: hypothetical protein DRP42_03790 [Mycoplasmatota bacterium]
MPKDYTPKTDIVSKLGKTNAMEALLAMNAGGDFNSSTGEVDPFIAKSLVNANIEEPASVPFKSKNIKYAKPEKSFGDKALGIYENFGLPALAVAETILSEGRSPGTTALNQQKILAGKRAQTAKSEKDKREAERNAEAIARKIAREEKLFGFQKSKFDFDKKKYESEQSKDSLKTERENLLRERTKEVSENIGKSDTTEGKKQITLDALAELAESPKDLMNYLKRLDPEDSQLAQLAKVFSATQNKITARETAPKRMSSKQLETVSDIDSSLDQLSQIKSLFKPAFVGPWMGRVSGLMDKVGILEPDEAVFRSAFQEFKNVLIKVRSGGAVTPQEAERLEAEVSNFNVTPEVYQARLARVYKTIISKRNRYIGTLGNSNIIIEGQEKYSPLTTKELKEITNIAKGVSSDNSQAPQLPQIKDDAGYNSLPSGSEFIDPQGNKRRKP